MGQKKHRDPNEPQQIDFGNNAFLTGDWSTGGETETNISDACFVRLVE